MRDTSSAFNLHTMAGHKHIGLAAMCLSSIVRNSDRPIHVIVHEDGSVTDEDVALFQESVPQSEFVFKRDADPILNEAMAKYPACRKLRDNLVYGLKIFDIQVLEPDPELSYTDCDILFLRPITNFFHLPEDKTVGGVFMRDPLQAYSLTPAQYLLNAKLKLADRLNGGLLHFRRSDFDWDLVEWFLSHDQYCIHPYWKEQTAWSVLAAATNSWYWDEGAVRVITKEADLTDEVAVAHYVSNYRHLIDLVPKEQRADQKPVTIAMHPFSHCTRFGYAADRSRWFLRRACRKFVNLSSFAAAPSVRP